MSKIKNGGLDQHGKVKALTGSAVKGLRHISSDAASRDYVVVPEK